MNDHALFFSSAEELADAAAGAFCNAAAEAITTREKFVAVLSGGATPKAMYNRLASPEFARRIDWEKVFIFWGDERMVPLRSCESNSGNAIRELLSKKNIPAENIFAVPTEQAPASAAAAYEKSIQNFFENAPPIFDLIFLGMGADGHTASIFPGSELMEEKEVGVRAVFAAHLRSWRVSFTPALINIARKKIFLVSGKDKETVLEEILSRQSVLKYPAQLVTGAEWFCFTASG